jgi:hypothetical protein
MMRAFAWLLLVIGVGLTVAAFFIAATTTAATLWPGLAAGFCLTMVGLIVLATRRPE